MAGDAALDQLPQCQFGTTTFPAEKATLHSVGRHHVHEYPHTPGGAPEKLGRGLWYMRVRANFQNTIRRFQNLYPDDMVQLRTMYELQQTATFTLGTTTFEAFIISWSQEWNPKIRSGEKVDLEFLEDQRSQFLTQATPSVTTMASQAVLFAGAAAFLQDRLRIRPSTQSLFSALQSTVNAVLAISDTVGAYSQLLNAKAAEVQSLCQRIDNAMELQTPTALSLIEPLHEINLMAQQMSAQYRTSQASLSIWTVPVVMSLPQIAMRLYGDTSRQEDLLELNVGKFNDPMRIRASTQITYYPKAA